MRKLKTILFILLVSSHFSFIKSQELDSLFQLSLGELMNLKITSSTKKSENINKAPSIIFAITEKEIKEKGYETLLDLLKAQSAWDFDMSYGGWVGQVAYLRGTRSNTIPIMIDGVLQNNINEGEMHLYHTINLDNIKQVEIITGPASALYGPNALVGIINLITKKTGEVNGVSSSLRYESSIGDEILAFNKYDFDLTAGNKFKNGFGFSSNFHFIKNDDEGKDYYDPDNIYKKGHIHYGEIVPDDGFNNHQNDFITSIRLTKDNVYTLGLDFANINEGTGSFLDGANYMVNSDSVDNRWHTHRLSAFSRFDFDLSDKLKLSPTLYYKKDQVMTNSGFAYNYDWTIAPRGTFRYYRQYLFRYGVDFMLNYNPTDKLSLVGGLVLEESQTSNESRRFGSKLNEYNNIINSDEEILSERIEYLYDTLGNITDTLTYIDTVTYQNNQKYSIVKQYSVYYQADYTFNDHWRVLIGGRYYKESDINGVFTPRAGIVYNTEGLISGKGQIVIKALYGQSFKPLANEDKYDPRTGELFVKGLKPAKNTTYELATTYLSDKYLRLELIGWSNSIKNYYVYGTDCGLDNIDQITYGFQALGKYQISRLSFDVNYTYTDGKNKGQWYYYPSYAVQDTVYYDKLIRVSKHKVNAYITYYTKQRISFSLGMKYVGKRNASPINLKYGDNEGFYLPYTYSGTVAPEDQITYNGNGYMPGYTLFNLHVNINDFGYFSGKMHGLSASLSVTNLLNTDYLETPRSESRVSPPYHPQPGRRFAVKIAYKF